MEKLYCSCNEFTDGIKEINDAIDFFRNHSTEYEYNTISFKFCPWCGKELEKETKLITNKRTINGRIYSTEIIKKISDQFNKEKEITLTCNLISADQPTVNGHIYSKEIMQEIVDKFNKKEHKLGQLSKNADENNSHDIKLESISHKCENLRINSENKFEGDVIPIGPQSKILENLNKDQLQLFPRILGVIDKNNQVIEVTDVISFDVITK